MAKRNRNGEHRDPVSEKKSKIVRTGYYDGSTPSSDFVVSGHSSGSSGSEMEALSHQVSIDAGVVPDYSVDNQEQFQTASTKTRTKRNAPIGADIDLDGPELYGPKPTLLANRTLDELQQAPKRYRGYIWSAVGVVGLIGLAFAGYRLAKRFGVNRSDSAEVEMSGSFDEAGEVSAQTAHA